LSEPVDGICFQFNCVRNQNIIPNGRLTANVPPVYDSPSALLKFIEFMIPDSPLTKPFPIVVVAFDRRVSDIGISNVEKFEVMLVIDAAEKSILVSVWSVSPEWNEKVFGAFNYSRN